MIQGTDEWKKARIGRVTASRVADVIAKTKSGPSASRKNYLAELVAERLTGLPTEGYQNAAMTWGTDTEPQARAAYEFYHGAVEQVGFIEHPSILMAGASPDGLVGAEGMIEIKCPGTAKHIDTLLNKEIDGKYITQMQFQMACTKRAWVDFVSFDPRLPEEIRLFVKRVPRDQRHIAELEEAIVDFLAELETIVQALTKSYSLPPLSVLVAC